MRTVLLLLLLFCCVLIAGNLLYGQSSNTEKSKSLVQLNNFRQLFIDDYLIEDITNLERVQHQAIKLPDPIIVPDQQWEKIVYVYGTVLKEEDIYRMYYRASDSTGRKFICFAESVDGVEWTKPFLGVFNYNGSLNNNIIIEGVEISSIVVDLEDIPERRYKMYGYYNLSHSYVYLASPDGISSWEIITHHMYGGDVCQMNYDPYQKKFVVIYKIPEEYPYLNYRKFWLATSPDLISYSPGVLLENQVDSIDLLYAQEAFRVDPYGMSIFPYEGTYIGFNWIFYIVNVGFGGGTHIGPIDVHLAFNRELNGIWHRPFRYPILPRGNDGDWDDGMVFTASYPTIMDDEIWMYYGGFNEMHGMLEKQGKIGIVRWRLDGFVSLENKPEDEEGVFVSKELIFEGSRLRLNADASNEDAYIYAELCRPDGTVIPGFSREESNIINSNSIRHTVSWENGDDLSALEGDTIVLKLFIKNSNLYSLSFINIESPTETNKVAGFVSENVKFYPNPAKDVLYISSKEKIDKILVFSIDGKEILSANPRSELHNLNISELKAGLYLLQIQSKNSFFSGKFNKF
ncbi:MAG: T9SS type A sorting domain-containing protein [Bacteroidales bacterium]|nr:T9SS type A sorting domain-containing protein [Bacteroidales bacterium]